VDAGVQYKKKPYQLAGISKYNALKQSQELFYDTLFMVSKNLT